MPRTKKRSLKPGEPSQTAASPDHVARRGEQGWFSSAFVRSGTTSAAIHTTVLLLLAMLYASDLPQPSKPIALSFEESDEAVDVDGPAMELALELPDADLDQSQESDELIQVLSDIPNEVLDVAYAFAGSISEPEVQFASLSHADIKNLNAVVTKATSHEQAFSADGGDAGVGMRVQLVGLPISSGGRNSASGPTSSELISANEFGNRLKAAGAKTGDVQISLAWNTIDDIDLHVTYTPGNGLVDNINWTNRLGRLSGGMLDVDMNAHSGLVSLAPVENVFWPPGSSPKGYFTVYVHFFRSWSGQTQVPVLVRIKNGKEITQHSMVAMLYANPQLVRQFTFPNVDLLRNF